MPLARCRCTNDADDVSSGACIEKAMGDACASASPIEVNLLANCFIPLPATSTHTVLTSTDTLHTSTVGAGGANSVESTSNAATSSGGSTAFVDVESSGFLAQFAIADMDGLVMFIILVRVNVNFRFIDRWFWLVCCGLFVVDDLSGHRRLFGALEDAQG